MKVLIVEDSPELAKSLRLFLELENNHVEVACDLAIAAHYTSVTHFDIILLDIMLPDGDGRDFLRSIRSKNNNIPVIVMTARSEISDRVDLLDIGADDYIIKPFEFVELEARCRAVLRRHSGQNQQALSYGDITVYPLSALIEFGNHKISLRNRELRLLEIFCNSPEILFSKEQLTDRLFLISDEVTENAVEVYIGRLRKKLLQSNVTIETVRGIGYRLMKYE
ncbi:response regulator transcription factor [Alphaproteobacteria bacterium]|mgnify:FL=1|nr:response regulator transcription factor [Alphaproteobacteria bacterium]MDC3311772.1 response regulator transcription factor [Alphaproteobacteria bacterium]